MCANLQSLPVEIVIQLLSHNRQRRRLCSFRLVCRSLYQKSLGVFVKLFKVVKTDMSAQSFKKLAGIANSDHLAPHVYTLRFCKSERFGALGRGFEWSRNTSGGLADPLADAYFMLQDILKSQLVNCRSFYINNYDEVGMSKESSQLTPGDVVSIIYSIIVNANLQVVSFKIESEGCLGRLSTERLLAPSLYSVKDHQRELSMWKSPNSLSLGFGLTKSQYNWALTLLNNAPGARQLSLRVNPGEEGSFFRRVVALRPFYAIESLTLDCITLNGTSLSRFLLRHRHTIQNLTLKKIRLASDRSEKGGTTWDAVFESLIGKMDRLNYVSLFMLYERYINRQEARVLYSPLMMDEETWVVPGSEEPTSGYDRVSADARVVVALESPVRLRYKNYYGRQRPHGATYKGTDMDQFFVLLRLALNDWD